MWSGENQGSSEFSVSSFGISVPQLVKGSRLQRGQVGSGTNHDVHCGLLGVYPSFLQSYRTPRCYLFFLCVLGMTQGFVVNGLVSVVTPTIEKRFQLLGIEVGVIQSMFNVASCIMVTPVSYHGGVGHKPVILGIGALVMSAGAMVFASPHFIAPQYLVLESGSTNLCPEHGPGKCSLTGRGTNANAFKYFFMIGHALHGVGSSPFFTLGVAYLDQNVPSGSASIYMGVFYATSVLGPAMGFLLGGFFLSKYTDITADTSQLGMDSSSTNWVGAWWIGFFGASIVMFLAAFPVASFPRELPTAKLKALEVAQKKKEKEKQQSKQCPGTPDVQDSKAAEEPKEAPEPMEDAPEQRDAASPEHDALEPKDAQSAQRNVVSSPNPVTGERSFVNHVRRLIYNPTFICLTLAASAETMVASGLTGFATKIFISMFGISSSQASGLLGAVAVPSACGGTLLGGYVITKLNVKSSTIVRYCVILSFVPWFTLFVFMHSCDNTHSALVNLTTKGGAQKLTFPDLERGCNAHCNCTGVMFDPVCGSDNFTYYSPCIAGCADEKRSKKTKLYTQCTCVNGPTLSTPLDNDTLFYYMAKRDPCSPDCNLVLVYAGAIFIALFFTFLLIVPALTALLRSIDEDVKSTGIGVNYVAIRLLGTIPGPILFGHLIDRSCVLWQGTCSGGSGACAVYENSAMGMNLFRVMISVKSASILFFFCASLSSRTQSSPSSPHAEGTPAAVAPDDGGADKPQQEPEQEQQQQLQNLGGPDNAENLDRRKEDARDDSSRDSRSRN
ncbi:solute carrier organic anion transporter family member 4A1-like [Amblyomma americanum]